MHAKIALIAGTAAVAVLAVASPNPVLADPPGRTVPALADITGTGSGTSSLLMDAFAARYDGQSPAPAAKVYSWDATDPANGQVGDTIITKAASPADFTCGISRPDGSSAGIAALGRAITDQGHPCLDFARSSLGMQSGDPPGLLWVAFAKDIVTWTAPVGGAAKPASLTQAQMQGIYQCAITNWNQVGGGTGTIVPVLPQTRSGTRAFFLAAIGILTPGPCVVNGSVNIPGDSMDPVPLQQNTGVSPSDLGGACTSADWTRCLTGNAWEFTLNPNAIYPYSAGDWIAQTPAPAGGGHATPATFAPGVLAQPKQISGTSPILTHTGGIDTLNPSFSSTFARVLWNVTRNAGTRSSPAIPSGLLSLFGSTTQAPHGLCSDSTDIQSYGFETIGVSCGAFFEAS